MQRGKKGCTLRQRRMLTVYVKLRKSVGSDQSISE